MRKKTDSLVTEIVAYQKDTCDTLKTFIDGVGGILEKLKPGSDAAKSLGALLGMYHTLYRFTKKLLAIERLTLPTIEKILAESNIKKGFETLDENFPSNTIVSQLHKVKDVKQFEADSRSDLVTYIRLPYNISARWRVFWNSVLDVIEKENPERASYQQCLSEFSIVDQQQNFKKIAERFQKQLEMLKHIVGTSNIAFTDMRLHYCVTGSVMKGDVMNPTKEPALLFLCDDRITLLITNAKVVKTADLRNVWIVPSAMFSKASRVVDVLGTEYSFAFQPASGAESEELWKNWHIISVGTRVDFSIFQPVTLSDEAVSFLDWVEINE